MLQIIQRSQFYCKLSKYVFVRLKAEFALVMSKQQKAKACVVSMWNYKMLNQ
jgi:hypothetical protein